MGVLQDVSPAWGKLEHFYYSLTITRIFLKNKSPWNDLKTREKSREKQFLIVKKKIKCAI